MQLIMSEGAEDEVVVKDFESTLDDLQSNSKPHINMLTMLAEESAQFSSGIALAIENHIKKVPPAQKLPTLYLLDSIVKNCSKTSYKDLFARNLINTFVKVFSEVDEKQRASLFKLRQTWTGIFPASKLYGIDIKVKQIDPAWPITEPAPTAAAAAAAAAQQHTIHVNPRFLGESQHNSGKASTGGRTGTDPSVIAQREKELRELQRKKQVLEQKKALQTTDSRQDVAAKRQGPQSVVTVPRDPRVNRTGSVQNLQQMESTSEHREGAKRNNNAKELDGDGGYSSSSPGHKGRKRYLERFREEASGQEDEERESSAFQERNKKKGRYRDKNYRRQERSQSPRKSGSFELGKDEPLSESEARIRTGDVDLRKKNSLLPPKKRSMGVDSGQTNEGSTASESSGKELEPEDADFARNKRKKPSGPLETMEERPPPRFQKRSGPYGGGGYRGHRGYQRERPIPPSAHPRPSAYDLPPPVSAATFSEPTVLLGSHAFTNANSQQTSPMVAGGRGSGLLPPPPGQEPSLPRPPVSSAPSMLRPNLTGGNVEPAPRMAHLTSQAAPEPQDPAPTDPIPANNRIFVDGRAYEVQYIEDTPVIERNGLPHRIYFTGPPRDVVIDGVPHSLSFGDRKEVLIDGQIHVIRFGAPSRELYMGSYPFRGAFGGPPIYATINGIRHEIRLCGPPPEVKIEPEPCYELTRFLTRHQSQPRAPVFDYSAHSFPEPPPPPTSVATQKQKTVDVDNLLQSLLSTGLIGRIPPPPPPPEGEASRSPMRPPTPPIPCPHQFAENETLERKDRPPASLKDYSIRVLKIRYDTVVEALHQAKHRCQVCGLRFESADGVKFAQHMDWHFKENKKKETWQGRSRPWFSSADDWTTFTEFGEDASSKDNGNGTGVDSENGLGPNSDSVVTATAADSAQCEVCGEPFEQFWDEEDEVWKLRNAVLMEGKVFHPLCSQDVSRQGLPESGFLMADVGGDVSYSVPPGLDVEEPLAGAVKSEPHDICCVSTSTTENPAIVSVPSSTSSALSHSIMSVIQSCGTGQGVKSEPVDPDYDAGGPGTPLRDESEPSPGTPLRDEPSNSVFR